MNDLGKVAVIAGIMGALLLFGLFMHTAEPVDNQIHIPAMGIYHPKANKKADRMVEISLGSSQVLKLKAIPRLNLVGELVKQHLCYDHSEVVINERLRGIFII